MMKKIMSVAIVMAVVFLFSFNAAGQTYKKYTPKAAAEPKKADTGSSVSSPAPSRSGGTVSTYGFSGWNILTDVMKRSSRKDSSQPVQQREIIDLAIAHLGVRGEDNKLIASVEPGESGKAFIVVHNNSNVAVVGFDVILSGSGLAKPYNMRYAEVLYPGNSVTITAPEPFVFEGTGAEYILYGTVTLKGDSDPRNNSLKKTYGTKGKVELKTAEMPAREKPERFEAEKGRSEEWGTGKGGKDLPDFVIDELSTAFGVEDDVHYMDVTFTARNRGGVTGETRNFRMVVRGNDDAYLADDTVWEEAMRLEPGGTEERTVRVPLQEWIDAGQITLGEWYTVIAEIDKPSEQVESNENNNKYITSRNFPRTVRIAETEDTRYRFLPDFTIDEFSISFDVEDGANYMDVIVAVKNIGDITGATRNFRIAVRGNDDEYLVHDTIWPSRMVVDPAGRGEGTARVPLQEWIDAGHITMGSDYDVIAEIDKPSEQDELNENNNRYFVMSQHFPRTVRLGDTGPRETEVVLLPDFVIREDMAVNNVVRPDRGHTMLVLGWIENIGRAEGEVTSYRVEIIGSLEVITVLETPIVVRPGVPSPFTFESPLQYYYDDGQITSGDTYNVRLTVNPYPERPEEYNYGNNARTASWEFNPDAPEI